MLAPILGRTCCRLLASTRSRCLTVAAPQLRLFSSAPSQFGLSLQYRDDVAIIKMDNNQNAIRADFLHEFLQLLDTVEQNENCRALVTTGVGKFYSNGLDLQWLSQRPGESITEFLDLLNTTLHRVLMFPIPTMAVMNGHAYAGGAILAFAHDLRTLNSERGWIRFTEVIVNIPFSEFMINYLKVKFGGGRSFTDATTLARKYTAQDAVTDQLVHAAYPPDALFEESIKLLNGIVPEALPRQGVLTVKGDVYKDADLSITKKMNAEDKKAADAKALNVVSDGSKKFKL